MKKKLFGSLVIAVIFMFPFLVKAENDDALNNFVSCVSKNNTCTLTGNVELTSTLVIKNDVVIDLAGYQITSDASTAISILAGNVTIKDTSSNSTGIIEVSGEAFRMGTKGVTTDSKDSVKLTIESGVDVVSTNDSCVVIYAGTLETAGNLVTKGGNYATVTGSGSTGNEGTVINITGGIVQHDSNLAVYQPQDGTLTIDGGTITGKTGVEVRSGTLVVNGGTIIGTHKPVEVTSNGNGSTSMGVGIAVAQHTTKLAVNVTINGGTIQGFSALYQSNPEENSVDDIVKINITVKGGTFETINEGTQVLYSENDLIVVENGSFSGDVSENFAIEGSDVYYVANIETGETKYIVATEAELETKVFEDEENVMSAEEYLKGLEESECDEDKELLAEIKKVLEGKSAISSHNIFYGSFIEEGLVVNSIQTELEKAVKVTLNVPKTLEKVKDGYNRKYSVIRLHWDEETQKMVVDVLDAKENKDGTVSFETDKFSTYILAYEDVKDTTNPNTFDGISSIMIVACVSLVSLLAVALYAKNQKVFN